MSLLKSKGYEIRDVEYIVSLKGLNSIIIHLEQRHQTIVLMPCRTLLLANTYTWKRPPHCFTYIFNCPVILKPCFRKKKTVCSL